MRNNKYTLYVHKNILKLKKVLIYFYVFDEWFVVVFFQCTYDHSDNIFFNSRHNSKSCTNSFGMTLREKAMKVAKEVSDGFEIEFGFKPMIGGSLSLILHGYFMPRYANSDISFNDVDLLVYEHEMGSFYKFQTAEVAEGVYSERAINLLQNYVSGLRSELYTFNCKIDLGPNPHFIWIGDVKVANPMHSLYAKAGYVLEEIGEVASSPKYQRRKLARIEKHFNDILDAKFKLAWYEPAKVSLIKTQEIQKIVYQYIETHERILRTQFFG